MHDALQVASVFAHAQQVYVVGKYWFAWYADTCRALAPFPIPLLLLPRTHPQSGAAQQPGKSSTAWT